jgi:hypothetical protein
MGVVLTALTAIRSLSQPQNDLRTHAWSGECSHSHFSRQSGDPGLEQARPAPCRENAIDVPTDLPIHTSYAFVRTHASHRKDEYSMSPDRHPSRSLPTPR